MKPQQQWKECLGVISAFMRQSSRFMRQIAFVTGKSHIGERSPFSPYYDHNSDLLFEQSATGSWQDYDAAIGD
jgi:hypothetical protein